MELFLEKFFSADIITFLCVIGLYAFILWCHDNFKSLFQIIFSVLKTFFLPYENKSLIERYGKWAGEF